MKSVKVNGILAELRAKVMDYVDVLCALLAWKDEDNLNLMRLSSYIKFYTEDKDIDIKWTDSEAIYAGGINGIDIMDEECFVSASCDNAEQRMILRLKDKLTNKVQAYILEIA